MSDSKPPIEGIKLIVLNTSAYRIPDDPSFPYKLEVLLRVPSLMSIAMIALFSREEVVVRGMTREAIQAFIDRNEFETHPRLLRMTISQPELNDVIEIFNRTPAPAWTTTSAGGAPASR